LSFCTGTCVGPRPRAEEERYGAKAKENMSAVPEDEAEAHRLAGKPGKVAATFSTPPRDQCRRR